MTRRKIYLFISLGLVAVLLIYCWVIILSTDIVATWRHYVGLLLFLLLLILNFKNYKWTVIGTGIYLFLATFNLLAMRPVITTSWLMIGPIDTPHVQLLSFGLFILYGALNFDSLVEIYLDYKDERDSKRK